MPHITEMPMMAKMEKMKKEGKMKCKGFNVRFADDNSLIVRKEYEGNGMYDSKEYTYKNVDDFMKAMKTDFLSKESMTHLAKNENKKERY